MGRSNQYCLPGCREGGGGETLGVECHYKYDSWAGFADSVVFVLLLYWRPLDWSVLCGFHPGKDLTIELSFFCLFVFSHFIVFYCYLFILCLSCVSYMSPCLRYRLQPLIPIHNKLIDRNSQPVNVIFSILNILASGITCLRCCYSMFFRRIANS